MIGEEKKEEKAKEPEPKKPKKEKAGKKYYSDEINKILGLSDNEKISWEKLPMEDLIKFYIILSTPSKLMKVGKSLLANVSTLNLNSDKPLLELLANRPLIRKVVENLLVG